MDQLEDYDLLENPRHCPTIDIANKVNGIGEGPGLAVVRLQLFFIIFFPSAVV